MILLKRENIWLSLIYSSVNKTSLVIRDKFSNTMFFTTKSSHQYYEFTIIATNVGS